MRNSRYLVWCLLSLIVPSALSKNTEQQTHAICKTSQTVGAVPPTSLCTENSLSKDATSGITIQGKVTYKDCFSPHSKATLVIWRQQEVEEDSNKKSENKPCYRQISTDTNGNYQITVPLPGKSQPQPIHFQIQQQPQPFVTKFTPDPELKIHTFDIVLPADRSGSHHRRNTRDIHAEYVWDEEPYDDIADDKRNWGEGNMQWLKKRVWSDAGMNWIKKRSWGNANTDWLKKRNSWKDSTADWLKRNWGEGNMNWLKRKNWGAAEADWLKKKRGTWDDSGMTWLKKRTWGNANTDWLKRTWGDAGMSWLRKRNPSWSGAEAEWLRKRDWNNDDAFMVETSVG